LRELGGSLVALVKLWSELPVSMDAADPRLANVLATANVVARVRAEFPMEAPLYTAELLLRRRLGDVRSTVALASDAVERFPKDWAILVSAANAARDAKNPDAALGFARRALAVAPHDGSPLHDAAWAFWEAARPREARELFEELLEEFPDYPLSPEGKLFIAQLRAQH
jgi:tetratricopeptide (TPR) repeat protein